MMIRNVDFCVFLGNSKTTGFMSRFLSFCSYVCIVLCFRSNDQRYSNFSVNHPCAAFCYVSFLFLTDKDTCIAYMWIIIVVVVSSSSSIRDLQRRRWLSKWGRGAKSCRYSTDNCKFPTEKIVCVWNVNFAYNFAPPPHKARKTFFANNLSTTRTACHNELQMQHQSIWSKSG